MKKFIAAVASACLLSLTAFPDVAQAQAKWITVYQDANQFVDIETNSIVRHGGGEVTFLWGTSLVRPQRGIKSITVLQTTSCDRQIFVRHQMSIYDPRGNLIADFGADLAPLEVLAGTPQEIVTSAVCRLSEP